jgi:uncharacterized alkaline shock family protein YloU
MDTNPQRRGRTTIAPDVLITIARLSALGVPGVARLSPVAGGVDQFLKGSPNEGVRIIVKGLAVGVELYLVTLPDTNLREIARKVQAEVTRSIQDIVGMDVLYVNVHIEDVDYTEGKTF